MPTSPPTFRISLQPGGYRLGMGQPSAPLQVSFDPPDRFASEAAGAAFAKLLLLTPQDAPPLRCAAKSGVAPAVGELLRYTCGVARHLLQEGGVPVFAPEVILRADVPEGGDGRLEVVLQVPVIQHVGRARFADAYRHAFGLVLPFAGPDDPWAEVKRDADALCDSFIEPLRKTMRQGHATKPLLREAYDREIPFTHLSGGVYQLGTGARSRLVLRSATDADPAIGSSIAGRKDHTALLLQGIGVPLADAVSVRNGDAASKAARDLGFPVVVKPADRERGEGVFLDLESEDAVRDAYDAVCQISPRVLVQRRIAGDCHRLVAFQGKFVFGYTRHPAGVEGDGARSVRALVQAFNDALYAKAKHLQSKPIPFDDEALECLADQGLGPEDVLAEGRTAFMRKANIIAYAGFNKIVTDIVHPENIALVERIARFLRFDCVGLDLISTDPARPWYETGAAITEVNYQPQIGENTARANIAAMFPEGRGAIPVECFVGGEGAMRAGRRRLEALGGMGRRAALTSHDTTLRADGSPYHLAGLSGLFERSAALLRDPTLDALVVVVQTDELVRSGPPFRGNVTVTTIDTGVSSHEDPARRVPPKMVARLVQSLNGR